MVVLPVCVLLQRNEGLMTALTHFRKDEVVSMLVRGRWCVEGVKAAIMRL